MVMFTPEEIEKLRRSLGLSRAEFAKKLGVHRNTVYWWETGHAHPRYDTLVILNSLAGGKRTAAAS